MNLVKKISKNLVALTTGMLIAAPFLAANDRVREVTISSSSEIMNGDYLEFGQRNGRPQYLKQDIAQIYWNGYNWSVEALHDTQPSSVAHTTNGDVGPLPPQQHWDGGACNPMPIEISETQIEVIDSSQSCAMRVGGLYTRHGDYNGKAYFRRGLQNSIFWDGNSWQLTESAQWETVSSPSMGYYPIETPDAISSWWIGPITKNNSMGHDYLEVAGPNADYNGKYVEEGQVLFAHWVDGNLVREPVPIFVKDNTYRFIMMAIGTTKYDWELQRRRSETQTTSCLRNSKDTFELPLEGWEDSGLGTICGDTLSTPPVFQVSNTAAPQVEVRGSLGFDGTYSPLLGTDWNGKNYYKGEGNQYLMYDGNKNQWCFREENGSVPYYNVDGMVASIDQDTLLPPVSGTWNTSEGTQTINVTGSSDGFYVSIPGEGDVYEGYYYADGSINDRGVFVHEDDRQWYMAWNGSAWVIGNNGQRVLTIYDDEYRQIGYDYFLFPDEVPTWSKDYSTVSNLTISLSENPGELVVNGAENAEVNGTYFAGSNQGSGDMGFDASDGYTYLKSGGKFVILRKYTLGWKIFRIKNQYDYVNKEYSICGGSTDSPLGTWSDRTQVFEVN